MRWFIVYLSLLAIPGAVRAAAVDLPEWENADAAAGYSLGGGLWPIALVPAGSADPAVTGVANADATTEAPAVSAETQFYGPQGAVEDGEVSLVGQPQLVENADGTFVLPQEPVEIEAVEPLPPIEGELRDLYFAHPPVDFLIDPQRLLTEQKSNDIMRFLEFHSDESKFKMFVMALGEDQKVPADINIQDLHKTWFSDSPTVLVLYYREKPELTELVFNESVRVSLPDSVFDRILQNCLREGAMTDLAPDQVEKIAIELSIQLYWLSRLIENGNGEEQTHVSSSIHEMIASPDAPELLREYAPGIFIDETSKVLSLVFTLVVILGVLAVIGLGAWIVLLWRGREKVSGQPVLFPEFKVSPRLGGEFCGGGFVGMSFELGDGAS